MYIVLTSYIYIVIAFFSYQISQVIPFSVFMNGIYLVVHCRGAPACHKLALKKTFGTLLCQNLAYFRLLLSVVIIVEELGCQTAQSFYFDFF